MAKSPSKPSSDLVRENAALMAEANSLYDQINAIWEKAEQKLREIGVLKPFEVHLETDETGDESAFGVSKEGGKWRIHLISSNVMDEEGHNTKWTLLTECPVETRVYFVEYLPRLFEELVASNREAVANLRKAASKSADMFKQLDIDL